MPNSDIVVDWKGLKAIGLPYCRAHIWREMKAKRVPQAFKRGKHSELSSGVDMTIVRGL
jgi:hypothetical protein